MAQKSIRCFVAVDLPQNMRDQIAVMQREINVPGVKVVNSDLIHLTLKFLGDVPIRKVDRVVDSLRNIDLPAFSAKVRGVGTFPGRSIRVIWIGAEGQFSELHRQVDDTLGPLGFEKENREFSAHATIARVKHPNPDMSQMLASRLNQFKKERVELGEFQVNRFLLKKSTLTPKGPIYDDIATFALRTA
ncbi:MAG: RNA 2',3'-cyclic phosphodiesterase [Methanotrichaceae archaeon]